MIFHPDLLDWKLFEGYRTYEIMGINDLLLTPFFLFFLFAWAYIYRDKKYFNSIIRKYFIPALAIRIFGAICSAFLYEYYYDGGDTFSYKQGAHQVWWAFLYDPSLAIEIVFSEPYSFSKEARMFARNDFFYAPGGTKTMLQISGFLAIISFNTYLIMSFILTTLAFLGCWYLFKMFYELYPKLHKELAISILFIPSVFFWGTGLMKDSVTLGMLGLLVYSFYSIFIKRRKILLSVLVLIISSYFIFKIKVYIIIALFPALVFWLFLRFKNKIRNNYLRIISAPILLCFTLLIGYGFVKSIGANSHEYDLENISKKMVITQTYILHQSKKHKGSGYDLGSIEPSVQGIAKVVPKAIAVSLFRPYIWEVRKPINLPLAIESLIALIFTIFVFIKVGIFNSIKSIFSNPEIAFCFIFSIIFAAAVGISAGNFGTLARYKVPCLPFYFVFLFILLSQKSKFSRKLKQSM